MWIRCLLGLYGIKVIVRVLLLFMCRGFNGFLCLFGFLSLVVIMFFVMFFGWNDFGIFSFMLYGLLIVGWGVVVFRLL